MFPPADARQLRAVFPDHRRRVRPVPYQPSGEKKSGGLGTFLSGFIILLQEKGDSSGRSAGMNGTLFSRGSTRLRKLVILGGWFACLQTVRAIHSNGRKKRRTKMKIGMTTDPTMTTTLESGTARVNRTAAGVKRGRTAGDVSSARQPRNFSPPPEAHFVSAERRERPRGTREKRIRLGTPSRTPDLFLDYVGGRFVPASVRRRTSRRSESGKLRSSRSESSRGGTEINVSDFQVHVFDLSPGASSGRGAQVKGTGGPAGSSKPVRVVRFRKLASPAAEAGATWQLANVSAKVRVKTPGGGGREPVVVGRIHTHTHTSVLSS